MPNNDTPISSFQDATEINSADKLTGLQNNVNRNFSFSTILSWFVQTVAAAFVPVSRKVNNKALSADITLDASDVGAQAAITASGILKGDGAGGVSAAVAGTDYGTYSKPSGGIPSSDMTSAVQTSLGKADSAYQKPSGGIPSSDMASAVQTSLGLADSAYQLPSGGIPASDLASGVIPTVPSISASTPNMDGTGAAGSTGEVSDAGHTHPSDTSRVPVYGMGKNLLDNWYFLNPVNQRGATSGSAGYCIDRWKASYGSGGVSWSLTSDGLSFQPVNTSSYGYIAQVIDSVVLSFLIGKRIHVHAITSSGDMIGGAINYAANATIFDNTYSDHRVRMRFSGNELRIESYASALTLKCVKFELGTEQTFAHLENSIWVPNQIPDYEEELIKCQTSTADSSDTYANKSLATEQQLAYVETGTTASRAYAVGEYFCWNGLLYRVTAAISSGGTFTPGTNCEQVTEGGLNSFHCLSGELSMDITGVYMRFGSLVTVYLVTCQVAINGSTYTNMGNLPFACYQGIKTHVYGNDREYVVDIAANSRALRIKWVGGAALPSGGKPSILGIFQYITTE